METDWNKLIERYLQNELSEEGKEAFEYELNTNPDLKMEYDLHLMIMGSAVRSAERMEIASIGKKFHFRKKLMNAAIISGVVLTAAFSAYWILTHQKTTEKPKQEVAKNEVAHPVSQPIADDVPVAEDKASAPVYGYTIVDKMTAIVEETGFSQSDEGMVAVSTKSGSVSKEEKKTAPETEKYWITTIEHPGVSSKSSTREEKPFYLSGNYTWAGNFMIMDTPEGLYMFDTTTNHLTVFKSGSNETKIKYSETVLFGIKRRRYPRVTNENKKVYSTKQEWGAH